MSFPFHPSWGMYVSDITSDPLHHYCVSEKPLGFN